GTIAGDDTILIIAADDEAASSRADWLMTIVSGQEDSRGR
ncbi:MAG: arginine repressor, partial [Bifidobacterium sp.]|nr:arginine repressor [Bifidobacterium sp.]